MIDTAWHIPTVAVSRGTKIMSRIRGGGVVVSRTRIRKDASGETLSLTEHRKLRVVCLPNRKAMSLKSRPR